MAPRCLNCRRPAGFCPPDSNLLGMFAGDMNRLIYEPSRLPAFSSDVQSTYD